MEKCLTKGQVHYAQTTRPPQALSNAGITVMESAVCLTVAEETVVHVAVHMLKVIKRNKNTF